MLIGLPASEAVEVAVVSAVGARYAVVGGDRYPKPALVKVSLGAGEFRHAFPPRSVTVIELSR